tara:strand:+ start:254 stop:739 length:486 start_codon:yes stop_codon:yes gene_type:complete
MIQAITETNLTTYLQTEDNRINDSVPVAQIRHLLKFTNDMDKSVSYAYGATETIYNRYTKFTFTYNATPNVYTGLIKFLPSGYWKYEVYEVTWNGSEVVVGSGTAPATETDVLERADTNGVVQGLVTKGKMYVGDKAGTAQVQYTQRQEPSGGTNYIYYGQ